MPLDIILITYNRLHLLKKSIEALYQRTRTPFRLIIVDNTSEDGTRDYLKELAIKNENIGLILLDKAVNICMAYNEGFKQVESELFITMQDDVIIPQLKPDIIQKLVDLINKYPEQGGIACRVQKIPNVEWTDGDLSPARKALSSYFRIQRKEDVIKMGGFGDRWWDDLAFATQVRSIGKKVSWATNLWCNHTGYMIHNKGYGKRNRKWGWSESRMTVYLKKPYPPINPKTNVPIIVEDKDIKPMMDDKCIKKIEDIFLKKKELTVLEWGAGQSTIYFSNLLKKNNIKYEWDSIEDIREWIAFVKKRITSFELVNNNVYYKPDKIEYINFPKELNKKYDVIIVDGSFRRDCLTNVQYLLKEDGIILLHDAHWYSNFLNEIDTLEGNYITRKTWLGKIKNNIEK